MNVEDLLASIDELEQKNKSIKLSRDKVEKSIIVRRERLENISEKIDITTKAMEILSKVSDTSVQKSYTFIANTINAYLEELFKDNERKIKIVESKRGVHPQLEIELYTDGGVKRSLKDDSGHGIAQIISLLSNLCLIVINGSRRFFVIDETLSGLSAESRKIVDSIIWTFTDLGFQFLICEHGYVPENAQVYFMKSSGGTSYVADTYISETGIYLNE